MGPGIRRDDIRWIWRTLCSGRDAAVSLPRVGRETGGIIGASRHTYPRIPTQIAKPVQSPAIICLSAYPRSFQQAYTRHISAPKRDHDEWLVPGGRVVWESSCTGSGIAEQPRITPGSGCGRRWNVVCSTGSQAEAGNGRGGGKGRALQSSGWAPAVQTNTNSRSRGEASSSLHADHRLRGRSLAPPLVCGDRPPPQPGHRTLSLVLTPSRPDKPPAHGNSR